MRLRPPTSGDRRPHRQGLEDLRLFLGDLPHLLEIAGARHARVNGGAHLSVAFALGAALPTTLTGNVDAVDTAGHAWSVSDNAPAPGTSTRLLEIMDSSPHEAAKGDAVVYVDLLPTGATRRSIASLRHVPAGSHVHSISGQWQKGTCFPRMQRQ